MLANILPLHTPLTPGVWSKCHFFPKVVMLHVKLRGLKQRTQCKQIFCPFIHPQPADWVKRSKHFFLKKVILHIKLKGKKSRTLCKFDLMHTPDLFRQGTLTFKVKLIP